jgi:hypothetical protein
LTVVQVVEQCWGMEGARPLLHDIGGVYHAILVVQVVVEDLVSWYSDADKLFVCGVCHLVFVEYLDDIVRYVKVLLGAEPAEIIAV